MWIETFQLKRRIFDKIWSKAPTSALTASSKRITGSIWIMAPQEDNDPPKDFLLPPSTVYGMKMLDREKFSKVVNIPYIVSPIQKLPQVLRLAKRYMLKIHNLSPVIVDEGSQKRILMDPFKIKRCFVGLEGERFKSLGIKETDVQTFPVPLSYDNWLADSILKAVLPADKEGVSSWSTIGHIIHVNLRDHLLDFKQLIGQVLLDKNKQVRTVVNKANNIDSTYRTFQIELLAGDNDMLAHVKENHCSYEFDFSKVYWNPRLVGEHERLVNELNSGDVLYDVFAGVGPFAIPAARKKCRVLANDLNPDSFKWLKHNVKINKVVDRVTVSNKDGADFIRHDLREDLLKCWAAGDWKRSHITMNLPAMAVEFLRYFCDLFSLDEKPSNFEGPIVYVYCFIKNAEDSSEAAKCLVESELGSKLGENFKSVSLVRTVSNNKDMMRVSFTLPPEVLFSRQPSKEEPEPKRLCIREKNEQTN